MPYSLCFRKKHEPKFGFFSQPAPLESPAHPDCKCPPWLEPAGPQLDAVPLAAKQRQAGRILNLGLSNPVVQCWHPQKQLTGGNSCRTEPETTSDAFAGCFFSTESCFKRPLQTTRGVHTKDPSQGPHIQPFRASNARWFGAGELVWRCCVGGTVARGSNPPSQFNPPIGGG